MKLRNQLIFAASLMALGATTAQAAVFTFDTQNTNNPGSYQDPSGYTQGTWFDSYGAIDTSKQAIAGMTSQGYAAAFFAFDMSTLDLAYNEEIVSATFYQMIDYNAFETYFILNGLYTPLSQMQSNTGSNMNAWLDIGQGPEYASQRVGPTPWETTYDPTYFSLNDTALSDIFAASNANNYFSLGMYSLGYVHPDSQSFGGFGKGYLRIETAFIQDPVDTGGGDTGGGDTGGPVSGIPEPATWLMMIMGFGLTGVAVRRRQQQRIAA